MIKAIVDSGSTKSDWRIVGKDTDLAFQTEGYNPYFATGERIAESIGKEVQPRLGNLRINGIHFYGAGCGAVEHKNQMHSLLQLYFPAAEILVETDMLGAARALCGDKEGLVAILGTGSNSGFYDGKKIIHGIDSLGFILGDEGSGAHIGRLILKEWLRKRFPEILEGKFFQFCQLSREEMLDNLYNKPYPNRFLAQFAIFAADHKSNAYIRSIVRSAFSSFITDVINWYPERESYPLNLAGSIAWYFSDILVEAAQDHHLQIGAILQSPIDKLANYHLSERRY